MRGRPKKKESNPQQSMEDLIARAVATFAEPYDDREPRDTDAPSLRSVAEELDTTILRVRKLLITADFFSTSLSREVQRCNNAGQSVEKIMEELGISKASVYSYIPYKGLAFNLEETTVNADRHKLFRQRVKAVNELEEHRGLPDELEYLWKAVIAFEGYPFHTSGRGSRPGVKFKYNVTRSAGSGGRHYSGNSVNGFGNEIIVEGKEKSIPRSTVELGYRRAQEMGIVKGPKALGIPGSGSYLYPVFLRLGVCSAE